MMKHKDRYAVAVRKPDGEIEIDREDYRSIVGNYHSLLKIPFVRGIFQFIDSMVLGMRTLTWSAGFGRSHPDSDFCGVYLADLQDGGYQTALSVSRSRA